MEFALVEFTITWLATSCSLTKSSRYDFSTYPHFYNTNIASIAHLIRVSDLFPRHHYEE